MLVFIGVPTSLFVLMNNVAEKESSGKSKMLALSLELEIRRNLPKGTLAPGATVQEENNPFFGRLPLTSCCLFGTGSKGEFSNGTQIAQNKFPSLFNIHYFILDTVGHAQAMCVDMTTYAG